MPNIDVVKNRLAEIETEFRTINTEAGERALNESEQGRWEALDAEHAEMRAAAEKIEADKVRAEKIAADRARWGSVQVAPVTRNLFDGLGRADAREMRNRAREVVSEIRYDDIAVSDVARQAALRHVESVPGAADLIMATSSPDYMDAFRSFMRSQGSPLYTPAEAEAVRASMSLTSANGGYVLPYLLDSQLIHTGSIGRNPIRAISRVETGTQKTWHGVTVSNVTTYWKSEGSAYTDGSPTTAGPSVTAEQLTAYVTGSTELFEDSNLLGQLPGLISEAFDDAESAAFVVGSGSTAPKGIITAISATAGCLVTATTRGSFTSASTADTFAMLNAIPSRYEDSVTWVGNKATFNTIRQQVVGTAGVPVVDMTDRGSLLGSPWVSASSVTATTTSGNFLMVLGDFGRGFLIYDRLGTTVEFVQNVVDGSGLPTGQRGLLARKRVGSDVVGQPDAFRVFKC